MPGQTQRPLSISPASGSSDRRPDRGITVRAAEGTHQGRGAHARRAGSRQVERCADSLAQQLVPERLAALHGRRHGGWNERGQVTRTSSFRTFTPAQTFDTRIKEGAGQTYGVGMPIILYFNRQLANKRAIERSLEIKTSKRVVGSWHWDSQCGTAPLCVVGPGYSIEVPWSVRFTWSGDHLHDAYWSVGDQASATSATAA